MQRELFEVLAKARGREELMRIVPKAREVRRRYMDELGGAKMEIGYVVKDAKKWEVAPERTASEFDIGYYGKLLEKAWEEVAYVLR